MIVPSIDLQDGQAVQLIGGEVKALDAGDPRPLAKRFGVVGEIAVVDLDAALGKGSNAAIVQDLVDLAPCRVGGGIRDVASAIAWLDRGARKVVLGTAARPEVLRELPRERVIAALDARHGEVVVEGWQKRTGHGVLERSGRAARRGRRLPRDLRRTRGTPPGHRSGLRASRSARQRATPRSPSRAASPPPRKSPSSIASAAPPRSAWRCTPAGWASPRPSAHLCAAIARMACGRPSLSTSAAPLLACVIPTSKSLRAALERGQGVYHSRSRGLWVKGATSGATQELLRIDADCDRDCLRVTVRQQPPGFCHLNTRTCWGADGGLGALARRLAERKIAAPDGSYTAKLFADPVLLGAKLREEAAELADAAGGAEVIHEAADVLYFTLATLARHGIDLAEVERALNRRALKVTRRE